MIWKQRKSEPKEEEVNRLIKSLSIQYEIAYLLIQRGISDFDSASDTITLHGKDNDNDTLTYIITNVPSSGKLLDISNNNREISNNEDISSNRLIYQTAPDTTGNISFTYYIKDTTDLSSNTETIEIDVSNIPIIKPHTFVSGSNNITKTTNEISSIIIDLSGADNDNQNLTYVITSVPTTGILYNNDNTDITTGFNTSYELPSNTRRIKYDTATDTSGNTAIEVQRIVTVGDTGAPVILLVGNILVTHEAKATYVDAGATASDTLDGNLTGSVTSVSTVNTDAVGSYSVTYSVSDANGNAAADVVRTVSVVDTTKPVISLEGNATIRHRVWRAYLDPGASASDTLDGNLTNKISTTNPVNASVPGTYEVSYSVSDAAGNAASTAHPSPESCWFFCCNSCI